MAFLEQIASRRLRLALNGLTPHKAKIVNLSSKKTIFNNSIECSFNPNRITYTACANYKTELLPGTDPLSSFMGNPPGQLDMDLLFDTTMTGDNVREKYIDFLLELTIPVKEKPTAPAEPPRCQFLWGEFSEDHLGFDAILKTLKVKYVWFLPNGRPVRAEVDVLFATPDEHEEGQNPTSRSEARSIWRVIEGQTLDWIAYQEYGDTSAWRHIAQVNNLQNPRDLRAGTVLKLVPLR